MKILLLIGKILGFGLLGILGLVLLVLLILLFLPICYNIEGVYEEKKALRLRFYDIFRIFCFSFVQEEEEGNTDLRVLWMHFLEDEEDDGENEVPEMAIEESDEEESDLEDPFDTPLSDAYFEEESLQSSIQKEERPKPKRRKKTNFESKEHKDDILGNIRRIIEDEDAKKGIIFLLYELGRFLRHLTPKKYRFQGEFYTGDPATTGQITGFLATVPWLQPKHGNYLLPDFSQEEFYLYGRMGIAGSMQLAFVFRIAVRAFFNRNVRKLYAYFKEND